MGMYNTSRTGMAPSAARPPVQALPNQPMPGTYSPPGTQVGQAGRQFVAGNPRYGLAGTSIRAPGVGGVSYRQQYNQQLNTPDQGGVVAGGQIGPNAVQQAYQQGPSLEQIQAEMARRNVGAQLNQNPANSALAGYMMG